MRRTFNSGVKNKDYSDYCYNVVMKLINDRYSKQFEEGRQIPLGYPSWSPNNVRRMIVSARGVIIQYHVSSGMTGKYLMYKEFDRGLVDECFRSKSYKSMISALTGTRVCSAIEEIVILTGDGVVPAVECNLDSIALRKGSGSEGLSARFLRLYGVVVINGRISELEKLFGYMVKEKDFLICKSDIFNGRIREELIVNSESWFKSMPNLQPLGVDGRGYIEDTKDGKLGKHFKSLIEECKAEEKNKKYDDMVRKRKEDAIKRTKEIDSKIEQLCSIIDSMLKSASILASLRSGYTGAYEALKSEDVSSNALMSEICLSIAREVSDYEFIKPESIKEYMDDRGMRLGKLAEQIVFHVSNYSDCEADSNKVMSSITSLYFSCKNVVYSYFVKYLQECKINNPRYFKAVSTNKTIYITSNFKYNSELKTIFKNVIILESEKTEASLKNIACFLELYSNLYLKNNSKYGKYTESEWLKMISK